MSCAKRLQKFLEEKFHQQKLTRKQFIQSTGFPASTVSKIFNASHRNPEFKTIMKIANYFNCTIDEVVGLNNASKSRDVIYCDMSIQEINFCLKKFLDDKLNETQLSKYNLGKKIGFNENIIADFTRGNNNEKALSTAVVVALADYFKVSIDEMIGRVHPSTRQMQPPEETKERSE